MALCGQRGIYHSIPAGGHAAQSTREESQGRAVKGSRAGSGTSSPARAPAQYSFISGSYVLLISSFNFVITDTAPCQAFGAMFTC